MHTEPQEALNNVSAAGSMESENTEQSRNIIVIILGLENPMLHDLPGPLVWGRKHVLGKYVSLINKVDGALHILESQDVPLSETPAFLQVFFVANCFSEKEMSLLFFVFVFMPVAKEA